MIRDYYPPPMYTTTPFLSLLRVRYIRASNEKSFPALNVN